MAEVTLSSQQTYPIGTTVKAYLRSAWAASQLPPTGAPKGAVAAEGVVASDGTVKLTGLENATSYFAYAQVGGEHRYVGFQTGSLAAGSEYQAKSEKGQANGYASLEAAGKVPASQLPNAIMEYQGTWNANTNTPALADGAGSPGDVYRVSVAGTRNLGSGAIDFEVGDYAVYNGTTWEKSDTTDAVASVAGKKGAVTLVVGDVTGAQSTANLDTDSTMAANSDTKYASQKASKAYADRIKALGLDFVDAGLTACTVRDPATAATGIAPAAGVLNVEKCPVALTTSFKKIFFNVSTASSAENANCFVAAFNSAGERLGVSADISTQLRSTGDKEIELTADEGKSLEVAGGVGTYVWIVFLIGTQGTTNCGLRAVSASSASANFALAKKGLVLRCGTSGSGQAAIPKTFNPATLAAAAGPILAGA